MTLLINIILFVAAFLFMEFVAWFTHKYVMHGFLWIWHKDHHINDNRKYEEVANTRFEKNDLFFLVYAIPAMILIITGFLISLPALVYAGFGITLYGFTYFMIHDVMIHQRILSPGLKKFGEKYFAGLIEAHIAHHISKGKSDYQSFGLLIFPKLQKEEK
jgi:beta-carotene 3-hydroxylase